jgi:transcriptional activator of cad operon
MTPDSAPSPARQPDRLQVGDWSVERLSGRLVRGDQVRVAEPKVIELLWLLAGRPGEVVTRQEIMAALWGDVVVANDSLARAVYKLRQALDGENLIETFPKRGYRLKVTPRVQAASSGGRSEASTRRLVALGGLMLVLLAVFALAGALILRRADAASVLVQRADDAYFQFTRADNEAAMTLYRRALDIDSANTAALSGLANTQVQGVLRWSGGPVVAPGQSWVTAGIATGLTQDPIQSAQLDYARQLAQRAIDLAPGDARALKALGFTASAQGQTDVALKLYARALRHQPRAWDVMINMADLHRSAGREATARGYMERAFTAMDADYVNAAARVRPWQSALGVEIARSRALAGDLAGAELWYRNVLNREPFHAGAATSLADLLRRRGAADEALEICGRMARVGAASGVCATS